MQIEVLMSQEDILNAISFWLTDIKGYSPDEVTLKVFRQENEEWKEFVPGTVSVNALAIIQ